DLQAQLARVGIPASLADSPVSRVPIDALALLLRHLQHDMRDEMLGLASSAVKRGTFALAGQQMGRCANLRDALHTGFDIYRLALPDFRARLRVKGTVTSMPAERHDSTAAPWLPRSAPGRDRGGDPGLKRGGDPGSDPGGERATISLVHRRGSAPSSFLESAFLYWVVGVASWLVQQRIPVLDVRLRGNGPPNWYGDVDERIFNVPTRFEASVASVTFEAHWLARPVAIGSAELRRFIADAPAHLLAPFRQRCGAAEQVRLRLHAHLGAVLPSLEQTAWSLRMTPHSLRRRLADEGRSFQDIKNHLRRDMAIEQLVHSSSKIDQIALGLGFSECSTFHRSFKLWTGLSPGEYRRLHRMDSGYRAQDHGPR
ncbi:MAG: AraC family transcriptional regulator, partial [Rhizobacter sp.]|nr:AraC family transcriptional regulator [Rhizobacter sp.]